DARELAANAMDELAHVLAVGLHGAERQRVGDLVPRDVRELGIGDRASPLDEQLQETELHRRELDRVLASVTNPEHAAVDALAEIELVAARSLHLGAEYELVAAGRRGAALTARRLDLRQRIGPEVELHVAEPDRRAGRQLELAAAT